MSAAASSAGQLRYRGKNAPAVAASVPISEAVAEAAPSPPPLTLAEELRQRQAEVRQGLRASHMRGPLDGGFSIFNRFDYVVFLILFIFLYFAVKAQYHVDLLELIWSAIKPAYDEE